MDGRGNQMNDDNKKDDTFEMIEILENATIIYDDGNRAIFEAILLTDKREIIFGQILTVENTDHDRSVSSIDCHDVFRECGGIPKDIIKSIEGGTKKTVFKKITF